MIGQVTGGLFAIAGLSCFIFLPSWFAVVYFLEQ